MTTVVHAMLPIPALPGMAYTTVPIRFSAQSPPLGIFTYVQWARHFLKRWHYTTRCEWLAITSRLEKSSSDIINGRVHLDVCSGLGEGRWARPVLTRWGLQVRKSSIQLRREGSMSRSLKFGDQVWWDDGVKSRAKVNEQESNVAVHWL